VNLKTERLTGVRFEEHPAIANRTDALELLDVLREADFTENVFYALDALKNAIERETI
jgi:hypothetical protein